MFNVMLERVLPWERKPFWTMFSDTGLLEDGPVVVEAVQGMLNVLQCRLSNCWAPDKITEVQECGYSANHVLRNVSLNCREPYLPETIRGVTFLIGVNCIPS